MEQHVYDAHVVLRKGKLGLYGEYLTPVIEDAAQHEFLVETGQRGTVKGVPQFTVCSQQHRVAQLGT